MSISNSQNSNDWNFFFKRFHLLSPPSTICYKEWQAFFTSFYQLNQSVQLEIPPPQILSSELKSFVQNFSRHYDKHRRAGNEINIWKISQVGEDELKNSAILAWLFDREGSHGQGNLFLMHFLRLLKRDSLTVFQNIKFDKPYWTRVESLPLGDKESRIDIEIESDEFLLFIEVKINAVETNNQIDRYINLVKQKAGSRPWAIVFLTRKGRLPLEVKHHIDVIPIRWHQIQTLVLDQANALSEESFVSKTLRHLSDHFSTLL